MHTFQGSCTPLGPMAESTVILDDTGLYNMIWMPQCSSRFSEDGSFALTSGVERFFVVTLPRWELLYPQGSDQGRPGIIDSSASSNVVTPGPCVAWGPQYSDESPAELFVVSHGRQSRAERSMHAMRLS